ncbi:hypothetical protein ACJIZ3_025503 [Penstemon smallii]|uniref:Cytochrome P450 n=1 Tax=Penstemon smallii TaxID=265156 RepID=A0ABD3TVU3_9LAMI
MEVVIFFYYIVALILLGRFKILGEQNLNGHHGNAHKYLRNLVLDLIGPENLKVELKAFLSFPLNIPGTPLHAALQGRGKAKKMIKCAFDARRLSKENNQDFIGHLLKEIDDKETILTEEIAADIVYLLLFAAFETTSTTITLSLKFLITTAKEHQQISNDRDDGDCHVTWKEYKSMNFTHMVINETVRLADNAPGIFRKVMQDVNIKVYLSCINYLTCRIRTLYNIPAGWTLVICPSVTHYNPNEYDNPYLFNPSRWQVCKVLNFIFDNFHSLSKYGNFHSLWKITKECNITRTPGLTFNKALCVQITKDS